MRFHAFGGQIPHQYNARLIGARDNRRRPGIGSWAAHRLRQTLRRGLSRCRQLLLPPNGASIPPTQRESTTPGNLSQCNLGLSERYMYYMGAMSNSYGESTLVLVTACAHALVGEQ